MKHLFLSVFCLSAFLGFSGSRVDRIISSAEKLGLSEDQLTELRAACEDYQKAEDKLMQIATLHGMNKPRQEKKTVRGDIVDPTIRKIQQQAKKYQNRFEVLTRTQHKWGPSTNILARAARQSMQSRLDETRAERDAAKVYEKQVKDLQKAAKKDGKNLDKLRKDLEKFRDKAETDSFRETCQGLLDILPVPNDDEK